MNLILMGPPGAGKGTQGEILAKKLNIQTISTGVMLRSAIKEGTEVGKVAAQYINDGRLVPDSVIVDVVKERLSKDDVQSGFILDGFPRTVAQAKALTETGIKIDKVLCIEVSDDEIVGRLSSRRECSKCGAPYNVISNKPEKDGVCDKCGGELIQRADDVPETIMNRLPECEFFRANRQYIISRKAINDISVWFGSRLSVNLSVAIPEKIIISKARVPEFKAWLAGNKE